MLTKTKSILGIGLIGWLMNGYTQESSQQVVESGIELPEVPAIVRDVHMSENDIYTRPTLPPTQTSADSRVALSHKGYNMYFRLHVPEKIETNFINSKAGTHIYTTGSAAPLAEAKLNIASTYIGGGQLGLCDPSFDPQSTIKNPRACDNDDCYDLTVVGFKQETQDEQVVRRVTSTPVMVRVKNPKTIEASIASVTVGETIEGAVLPLKDMIFETMVVGKGRLLVGRSDSTMPWTNSQGETLNSAINPIYFVNDNPDNFEPCDARQWDKVYPMSHAPYDDTINTRYGFAMQPFKDMLGNIIPEDTTFWGSYPWMDKQADNLSITTFAQSLLQNGNIVSDFAVRCAVENCSDDSEIGEGGNNGRVIMGLWTHGKMVHLDGLINHLNYGVRSKDMYQRELQFYQPQDEHDGFIRVGNGRENNITLSPLGAAGNTDFLDSNEHRFNYLKHMRPVKPADVVWLMSSGSSTEEVAFDDYSNVNSFINTNMTMLLTVSTDSDSPRGLRGMVRHFDRLQNAATSPRWHIPAYAQILGNGRIEHTANGGLHGRGFWLDGKGAGLQFTIAEQPQGVAETDWFYSLFIDNRYDSKALKTLVSFPDGSKILVKEASEILYVDARKFVLSRLDVSAYMQRQAWMHLGIQVEHSTQEIHTSINGMQIHTFKAPSPVFQLVPGALTVGMDPNATYESFKGWIDDFKVFAQHLDPESVCNHANGTLVGLTKEASDPIQQKANLIPTDSHDLISQRLKTSGESKYEQYVCAHDYTQDNHIHLGNLPEGVVSIRNSIHFPEGPIYFDAPRPASDKNAFCLSCHTANGKLGLGLDALRLQADVMAIDDPRRQPLQPDPRVYGVIPQDWLGEGVPEASMRADPETGLAIDQWILPSNNTDSLK
ncbi:MAG: hypothetical protein AAGB12_09545 [Pseudomonadota bacterium]